VDSAAVPLPAARGGGVVVGGASSPFPCTSKNIPPPCTDFPLVLGDLQMMLEPVKSCLTNQVLRAPPMVPWRGR
jgi:hypothetical protein